MRIEQKPYTQNPTFASLDCETAVLLRGWILPILDRASSWPALTEALAHKGYALAFRESRLCLTDMSSGEAVCTLRSLGTGLRELVTRLGRPAVRPTRHDPAAGDLCNKPTPHTFE